MNKIGKCVPSWNHYMALFSLVDCMIRFTGGSAPNNEQMSALWLIRGVSVVVWQANEESHLETNFDD